MRIAVLDGFAAGQGDDEAWRLLQQQGDVTIWPRTTAAELPGRCRGAQALVTNKVMLDTETLAALPDLRYVGVSATGTNVVDLVTARARGVAVTNVPGYAAESVAQLVFAMALHLFADVASHSAAVKSGRWAESPDFCFFLRPLTELAGRTLVVLGQGAIGTAVARIGRGFGMDVLAAAVPGSHTAGRTPLNEALPRAHLVSLHCPLVPTTAGLVGSDFLSRLRPGAVLINTSRGGLVDEAALVQSLAEGRLGGVGLDVLGREPPALDHPLTNRHAPWADRVVITPHIGWGTVEARARLRVEVADNLRAFLRGERRNRVD